jgi:hypothetical protein
MGEGSFEISDYHTSEKFKPSEDRRQAKFSPGEAVPGVADTVNGCYHKDAAYKGISVVRFKI